jgi:membrane protease YdiL (CAAX protease family)
MYLAGYLCYGILPYGAPMMIAPIPKVFAIINLVPLPVSTAFAEDGLYLGCGVNHMKNKYAAILIPAFFFALQHCFIPTLFDAPYILYRFLSFLPLTIILCWYYYKKRNPVPIMIGHALIDVATAAQILASSTVPGFYETICGF